MSVHSDETDFLLLIPPNFFSVPDSDDENPTSKTSQRLLVSDLISQVNELEGRVCVIERTKLREEMSPNCNLRHLKHYGSVDTLNSTPRAYQNLRSLQSTPLKAGSPQPNVLEPRQNILTSSNYVNQKEKDSQSLKEIDDFFKQKMERHRLISEGSAREDDTKLTIPICASLTSSSMSMNKVTDIMKMLEETQVEMERKLKLTEHDIMNDNEDEGLKFIKMVRNEHEAECENSGLEVCDQVLSKHSRSPMKIPRRSLNFDSLKVSMLKERGRGLVEGVGELGSGGEGDGNEVSVPVENGEESGVVCGTSERDLAAMLSLNNLWGANVGPSKTTPFEEQHILRQRLQEERCRRQHCEQQIQHLQLKLLEEEQKIAVAVKVDQGKDKVIHKMTEGWNKIIGHWRDLESQRNSLAKKLAGDRERFKEEISGTYQTVKRYEMELSKALDLAHGYKEKCESVDLEKKTCQGNLVREIDALKKELKSTTESLRREEEGNKKLALQVKAKEEVTNESKAKVSDLQVQMRELRKVLRDCEAELETLKQEKGKAVDKYREEKSKTTTVEQSRKALQQQNEELKKREKGLKEEVRALSDQVERTKVELKAFYQDQVENIVREKQQMFQNQLSEAQQTLLREIEAKEKSVTDTAVHHVQQIVEKHMTEVSLLEEKHREEVGLWQVKVAQCEDKIRMLHSVLETQWHQAVNIIQSSSGNTQHATQAWSGPQQSSPQGPFRQDTFIKAAEEGRGSKEGKEGKEGKESQDSKGPCPPSSPSTVSAATDTPFTKEGLVTCREQPTGHLTYRIDETPQKMPSASQSELQKYIQMLLERTPGAPTDDSVRLDSTSYNHLPSQTDGQPHWQQILTDPSNRHQSKSDRSYYSKDKRPWK